MRSDAISWLPPDLLGCLYLRTRIARRQQLIVTYRAHETTASTRSSRCCLGLALSCNSPVAADAGMPATILRLFRGADKLPDSVAHLRDAVVWVWVVPVVAHRCLDRDADRGRDHRRADPAQRVVALTLPVRACRVDLAPAHLQAVARAARVDYSQ